MKMMNVVLKMMIFCIKNDESCIRNDDILLFKMMNFVFKMMDFVFKMMNLGKSKSCIRSSPISANAKRSSTSTSASCFRINAVFYPGCPKYLQHTCFYLGVFSNWWLFARVVCTSIEEWRVSNENSGRTGNITGGLHNFQVRVFVLQLMIFVIQMMSFALNLMDFAFKMMDFALKMMGFRRSGRMRGTSICMKSTIFSMNSIIWGIFGGDFGLFWRWFWSALEVILVCFGAGSSSRRRCTALATSNYSGNCRGHTLSRLHAAPSASGYIARSCF